MLYRFFRFLSWVILRSKYHFQVRGGENLPKDGGFILASNHVSGMDPVVLGVASFRRLDFMAKQDLFANFFASRLMFAVGAFPVKRHSADLSAIREAIHRIKEGHGLLLFPEGSRRIDTPINAPLPGVGFLAAHANAPVIPAFISGTAQALPKGTNSLRPARISVRFGRQISFERRMPYQDFAQLIMENIRNLSC